MKQTTKMQNKYIFHQMSGSLITICLKVLFSAEVSAFIDFLCFQLIFLPFIILQIIILRLVVITKTKTQLILLMLFLSRFEIV